MGENDVRHTECKKTRGGTTDIRMGGLATDCATIELRPVRPEELQAQDIYSAPSIFSFSLINAPQRRTIAPQRLVETSRVAHWDKEFMHADRRFSTPGHLAGHCTIHEASHSNSCAREGTCGV